MSAGRPRRVFAASVVVTIAACSGSSKETGGAKVPSAFLQRWSVMKQVDDCRAYETVNNCPPGVSCNPPPPRAIACPAETKEDHVMVAELADHTCVVVPPMCEDLACATTKTACPLPFGEELAILRWEVIRDDKGACTAAVYGGANPVSVPCPYPDPLSGARYAVIMRENAKAPCFAHAREQMKKEWPCPGAAQP
jgi:hypothetical protein